MPDEDKKQLPAPNDKTEGYQELLESEKRLTEIERVAVHQYMAGMQVGISRGHRQASAISHQIDILHIAGVKRSKRYKGTIVPGPNGEVYHINTWAEYCSHAVGLDRSKVDEDILNLEALGKQVYDLLAESGIAKSLTTTFRRLPELERDPIVAEIIEHKDDPGAIEDLIRATLDKHQSEKERLEAHLKETRDNLNVKVDQIALKDKTINEYQERELARENLPVDEILQEARQKVSNLGDEVLKAIDFLCIACHRYFDAGGHTATITKDIEGQVHRAIEHLELLIQELNLHPGQFEFSWSRYQRYLPNSDQQHGPGIDNVQAEPDPDDEPQGPSTVTPFRGAPGSLETK